MTYLLSGRDSSSTSQFDCLTECIYRREDVPGSRSPDYLLRVSPPIPRICFASGSLAPECLVLHESLTNVSSALPALDNSDYQEKGEVVDLGGMEVTHSDKGLVQMLLYLSKFITCPLLPGVHSRRGLPLYHLELRHHGLPGGKVQ